MIKSVTITNHLGESVTLEMRNPSSSGFFIRNIEGLTPPKANIDTTEVSAIDGAIFNSSRVTSRNIVFSLGFQENPTIEDTRQKSYKFFPIKKKIKIQVDTDNRSCETYGHIESNEPDIFSKEEGTVISVICPDSYLYSVEKNITLFSYIDSLFELPFSNESFAEKLIVFGNIETHTTKSVYYLGDAAIGIVMYIHAIGPVTNVKITNVQTRQEMNIDSARLTTLTGEDIHAGDDIVISTIKGAKNAYLYRDGVKFNIVNCLGKYPEWFELEKGDNLFTYSSDAGVTNLQFRIENQIAFEGV